MDFPKTIPIPDFPLRCKEWQLQGYEVIEVEGRTVVFEDSPYDGFVYAVALYRNKRNKRYYLDKRSNEWFPLHRNSLAQLKKGKLNNSMPEQLWWNSLTR